MSGSPIPDPEHSLYEFNRKRAHVNGDADYELQKQCYDTESMLNNCLSPLLLPIDYHVGSDH
jgi:hypothetical protein